MRYEIRKLNSRTALLCILASIWAMDCLGCVNKLATFSASQTHTNPPRALKVEGPKDPKYETPEAEAQFQEKFAMVTFDLAGRELTDPDVLSEIKAAFDREGRVHVTGNAKYVADLPPAVLSALGFGKDEEFRWGGQFSGRTVRISLGNQFHGVDAYPAHLPVLAHQEIIYQPVAPRRLLFHYRKVSGEGNGGRTFVHSAKNLLAAIQSCGAVGAGLVAKMRKHGQRLISGFIDENHPQRNENYLRSWQVQFETDDINIAAAKASGALSYYDRVWFEKMDGADKDAKPLYLLKTETTIPLFKVDEETESEYLIFPRLGYDGPHVVNGFREYLLGDGNEFTQEELQILLSATWKTRKGTYQKPGDILIVDNLKFAHSREPYREISPDGKPLERQAGIVMAGSFYSDDSKGRLIKAALDANSKRLVQISPKAGPAEAALKK